MPASVGIAVFRYRLFDIELILSRTLIYGTLTGCVVGGYLGLFLLVDRLVAARGIAGVVAAGLVALGFQPLRDTLQRRVSGSSTATALTPTQPLPGSATGSRTRPIPRMS